jgi:hypothetical protein
VSLQEVNINLVLGVVVLSGMLFLDYNVSLCVIFVLNLVQSAWGSPLAFPMCRIVFHSYFLSAAVIGSWCILLRGNQKAAILCSMGVNGIRVNVYFSSCWVSVNLYFKAIVDSIEQKI